MLVRSTALQQCEALEGGSLGLVEFAQNRPVYACLLAVRAFMRSGLRCLWHPACLTSMRTRQLSSARRRRRATRIYRRRHDGKFAWNRSELLCCGRYGIRIVSERSFTRGAIHFDYRRPSLLSSAPCVQLRLEGAPIEYFGRFKFVSHVGFHRSLRCGRRSCFLLCLALSGGFLRVGYYVDPHGVR